MRRILILALVLLGTAGVPTAQAHGGDPNYRSVLHGLAPPVKGLSISVLGYDNQLQLINRSGRDVTVLGYDGEPYARLMADGTVQVNLNSPAYYVNEDRTGTTKVPSFASSEATPNWKTLDKTGRFNWHDHRMHWMGTSRPTQVHDKHKKTKIFDYSLPIRVGHKLVKADGTLFWVGRDTHFPVAAIIAIALALLAGIPLTILRQRRRERAAGDTAAHPDGEPSGPTAGPKEAW